MFSSDEGIPGASQAWFNQLKRVTETGAECRVKGVSTRELLGSRLVFDMRHPVVYHPDRKLNYKFMAAEALYIIQGRNIIEDLTEVLPAFSKYTDDGLTQSGAYGPMVMDQLSYVVNTLRADPASRQAVLTIWRPRPGFSKDIPCTLSMQFLIRDGVLHTIVNMRSSDVFVGLTYDMFCFSVVSSLVAHLVQNPAVEQVADRLGTCAIVAGSSHVYERDQESATEILLSGIQRVGGPEFDIPPYDEMVEWLSRAKWSESNSVARDILLGVFP